MDWLQIILISASLGIIKFVDLTDDNIIYLFQISFGTSGLFSVISSLVIYLRIKSAGDKSTVLVPQSEINPQAASNPFASLLGTNTNDREANRTVEMTTQEYDLFKLGHSLKQVVSTVVVVGFIHWKWQFVPPLVIQTLLRCGQTVASELFRIHLICQSPLHHKDLRRPFKPASTPFATFKALKKEVQQQMAGEAGKARKNKKQINRKRVNARD